VLQSLPHPVDFEFGLVYGFLLRQLVNEVQELSRAQRGLVGCEVP
jgi:hypothetical protein